MRTLGVDYGMKRVGLALSDSEGRLALPYRVIERTTREALFGVLAEIVKKEGVEAVVVGLPLSLDGEETLSSRQCRNFAASLARRTGLPVSLMDERLTSAEAERSLMQAGCNSRKRRKSLDAHAAALILRTHLDHSAGEGAC
ncbi:MAG: Holliday junction resolvase RuvX [Desulfovibrionaceae bacterium]